MHLSMCYAYCLPKIVWNSGLDAYEKKKKKTHETKHRAKAREKGKPWNCKRGQNIPFLIQNTHNKMPNIHIPYTHIWPNNAIRILTHRIMITKSNTRVKLLNAFSTCFVILLSNALQMENCSQSASQKVTTCCRTQKNKYTLVSKDQCVSVYIRHSNFVKGGRTNCSWRKSTWLHWGMSVCVCTLNSVECAFICFAKKNPSHSEK